MTIDLRTGEQYAPRPTDYMTRLAPVAPGGDCPLWRAFLARATDGDGELQAYLQRMCGYWLTGHVHDHALFFLYGTGANGKTVFIETVQGYSGDYALTAPIETFLAPKGERHPTELAMLRGARLVVAHETEAGRHWNESRIKALTGGDTIAARFMRQDFFTYKPTFKLCIVGNHKPALRTVNEAIRRRFHLVPFAVTIPPRNATRSSPTSSKPSGRAFSPWPSKAVSTGARAGSIRPARCWTPRTPISPPRTPWLAGWRSAPSPPAIGRSNRPPTCSHLGSNGPSVPARKSAPASASPKHCKAAASPRSIPRPHAASKASACAATAMRTIRATAGDTW